MKYGSARLWEDWRTLWQYLSHDLWADLRYLWRRNRRQPGLTLAIVLTLGVGLGANVAILTYFKNLFWGDFRAPDKDRLFWAETGSRGQTRPRMSWPD